MEVRVNEEKEKQGYYTVTPVGSIDSSSHSEFRERVNEILKKYPKLVVLNLEKVDYISSAGLGVLFSIKKFLIANDGDMIFCNLKPQIVKLFEIVKALPKENIFTSIKEADNYFYKIMNDEIARQKDAKKKE